MQVGLEQQLLEHDAERVRLARARLATQEGVAPETARVERERHAGREQQLADLEPGSPRSGCLEMVAHLVGGRGSHDGVVERQPVAAQDPALALGAADHDLGAVRRSAGVGRGEPEPLVPAEPERHDLAEPGLGALLEHDVRARLHSQPVEGRLIGEAAPVDRGRERQDLLLELPADGPVAVDALPHVDPLVAHGLTSAAGTAESRIEDPGYASRRHIVRVTLNDEGCSGHGSGIVAPTPGEGSRYAAPPSSRTTVV